MTNNIIIIFFVILPIICFIFACIGITQVVINYFRMKKSLYKQLEEWKDKNGK